MSNLFGKLVSSISVQGGGDKTPGSSISKLESTSTIDINNNVNTIDVNSAEFKEFQEFLMYKNKTTRHEHTPRMYGQSTSVPRSNDIDSAGESNYYAQPKAAVDDKVQLPEFSKFTDKSISTDKFINWKRIVVDAIDGSPRYRPLLYEAKKGWIEFQRSNSRYTLEHIEMYYLDAHRQLWSIIGACFDSDIIISIAEEMKTEALDKSLPMVLGFKYCKDYDFYKDVKVLLEKLSKRYEVKSGWEMCNLMKQFLQLEYSPEDNPIDYVEEFTLNYRRIVVLDPGCNFPDDMLAYLMLSQLPAECHTVKSQFLDVDKKPSLIKVREVLISWWQSHVQRSKSRSDSNDHDLDEISNNDIIDTQIE